MWSIVKFKLFLYYLLVASTHIHNEHGQATLGIHVHIFKI